jgi:UDP-sulfoquinovose synthase
MTEAAGRGKPAGESVLTALRDRPDDHDLWDRFRVRQFPGQRLNLDPGTIGTPSQAVRNALQGFWADELYAYPDGQIQRGRAESRRVRALAAALWGAEVPALTGGTTEAARMVAHALREQLAAHVPPVVLASGHEHPGGLGPFEREAGFRCVQIPDEALRDPDAVAALAAAHRPAALVLSQITYTLGQVLPVREIAAAVRAAAPEVFVVVDAAQALGLVAPACVGADVVLASGHKWLFGPPGCGLAWVSARARKELRGLALSADALDPDAPCPGLERPGVHDFSLYAGLAAALELHAALGAAAVLRRTRALAAWMARELHQRLHAAGVAHRFFDPPTGEAREVPPPAEALIGSISVELADCDPEPACEALGHAGIHVRCLQMQRGHKLVRLGAPCYESDARVRRGLDALVAALRR